MCKSVRADLGEEGIGLRELLTQALTLLAGQFGASEDEAVLVEGKATQSILLLYRILSSSLVCFIS